MGEHMMTLDTQRIWQNALGELQIQMRPADFRTWFRDTNLLSYDGDRCVVGVENPFSVEWLSTKCNGLVSRTLQGLLGKPVDVEFVVGRSEAPEPVVEPLRLDSPPAVTRKAQAKTRSARQKLDDNPVMSPRYVFDTFVVGTNNRLAHAASMAAADRPGQVHNPLFIYGGVGLGKTHLLHAIGHAALSRGLQVVYVSSETFTNQYIDSIRRGRMDEFRARYRQPDILLIDDIQFIAGKEQTQEEFFHTFNALYEASGQIVLTSDRHPKAITTLEDRLRSRFVWGLMTDIQQPDLETRIAILRAKMAEAGRYATAVAPTEVLDFIAGKVQSNIRELEGALNRVIAYATLQGSPVTLDVAAAALAELIEPAGRRRAAPSQIVEAVCTVTQISHEEIEGKQRDRRIVVPRQIAMYMLRESTELSLSEIGGLFGGRDHSTVLHSCEKIGAEAEHNPSIRATLRQIQESLATAG
jgi:chromosomal replication initiator protein